MRKPWWYVAGSVAGIALLTGFTVGVVLAIGLKVLGFLLF